VQIVLKLSKTEFEKYIFVVSSETKFCGSLFNKCVTTTSKCNMHKNTPVQQHVVLLFVMEHAANKNIKKKPSSAFVDLGALKIGQVDNFLEDESIHFLVKSSFKMIIIWASTVSERSR
jgi:hypothetical protein